MNFSKNLFFAATIFSLFFASGCSKSSSSNTTTATPTASVGPTVEITGTVSAPGATVGVIASIQSGNFNALFSKLFAREAIAAFSAGTAPVGAGMNVDLIEIDNKGNQVGSAIATTTTTATGSYTIAAPNGFTPANRFVMRAKRSSDPSKYLDAFVTSTTVHVNPVTDIAKSLVITAASGVGLANISPETIAEFHDHVNQMANEVGTFTDIASAKSLILAKHNASEDSLNFVSSISSSGIITGKVTDSSGAPLPNIKIIIRDFNNWVNRATTHTNASGIYTVHVPAGDYILGAFNTTTTSTAASEWWTTAGGSPNEYDAEKISVTTTLTKDWVLDPGVKVSGTVTGETTKLPVAGVIVEVRDFSNDQPIAWTSSAADGTYQLSVRPGNYSIISINRTAQPYASELYNVAQNGGIDYMQAEKVTLTIGTPKTADFSLLDGRELSGQVTDGGTAVAGITVRIHSPASPTTGSAFLYGMRTDLEGKYRLWLRPNPASQPYTARSRGQVLTPDLSVSSQTTQNFSASTGKILLKFADASGKPISQVKTSINDFSKGTYFGNETSNSDGSVTLYSTATAVRLSFTVDNNSGFGSQIYNGVTQTSSATAVAVAIGSTTDLGTVTLPAGGVLSGTITVNGVAVGNASLQVRSGGTANANTFLGKTTHLDGSYTLSLPLGTYSMRACAPAVACATTFKTVTIVSGANTLDFAI